MKTSESFNIVLLPDKYTQSLAIQMSKKINERFQTDIVLNSKNVFPHITLYQAQFPISNIEKIKKAIHKIAVMTKPFKVELSSLSLFFWPFLFWDVKKTKDIQLLHEKIVEFVNPLRNGLIRQELLKMKNLSSEYESDLKRYGALLIRPHYYPHITITRFKDSVEKEKVLTIIDRYKEASFIGDKIAFAFLGKFGTVYKLIQLFEFKK